MYDQRWRPEKTNYGAKIEWNRESIKEVVFGSLKAIIHLTIIGLVLWIVFTHEPSCESANLGPRGMVRDCTPTTDTDASFWSSVGGRHYDPYIYFNPSD